jgi:hypothetical protein
LDYEKGEEVTEMEIKTIYSKNSSVNEAVRELKTQSEGFQTSMVLYFASLAFDAPELASKMQSAFAHATVFGCSTSGELVSGAMLKGSITAMLFSPAAIKDLKVEVVENITSENRIPEAFQHFETYFHTPMISMDVAEYVGIILIDGLSRAEEKIMEKTGELTSVIFVGGSAGDDLKFQKTFVYANGKAYSDAAILALIKPAKGFDFIKTQSFNPSDRVFEATKVDEPNRKVLEFNHKPALVAYAEALGATPEEAKDQFMAHPLGLMLGNEPYVRSPQKTEQNDMVFFCNISQGMKLTILNNTNIVEDTRSVIQAKECEMGGIAGIINFNCILRTLELEKKGLTEDYGQVFKDIPTVGFSTYGEEYIGHINQTATMLVFKK